MKIVRLTLFLLFFVAFILIPPSLFAQFEEGNSSVESLMNDDVWSESLTNLKKSMSDLMQKNDLLSSENNVLRKRVLDLEADFKRLEQQREEDSKEPVRLNQLLQDKTKENAGLEKRIEDGQDEVKRIRAEKDILTTTIAQHTDKQKSYGAQEQALKNRIAELEKSIKVISEQDDRQLKVVEEEKDALTKKLESSQKLQAKLEEELNQAKAQSVDSSKLKGLLVEQDRIKAELAKMQQALDAANAERQKLQSENTALRDHGKGDLAEVNQEIDRLRDRNKELENILAQLKKESGSSDSPDFTKQVSELHDKISSLQNENKTLKDKIASSMDDIVKLNREKSMIESLLSAQAKANKKPGKESAKDGSKSEHQIMAYKYAADGQFERAIEEYNLALQEEPFKKDIYYNLGFIYSRLGRYNEAIDNYKQVLVLDSNDKEANFNLSQLYKKLSDTANSRLYYNKYLEIKDK